MKVKSDLFIIIASYVLEFIIITEFKYYQYVYFKFPEEITIYNDCFNNIEANISYLSAYYFLDIFYLLSFVYSIFILYDSSLHFIKIKRNSIAFVVLILIDFIFHSISSICLCFLAPFPQIYIPFLLSIYRILIY